MQWGQTASTRTTGQEYCQVRLECSRVDTSSIALGTKISKAEWHISKTEDVGSDYSPCCNFHPRPEPRMPNPASLILSIQIQLAKAKHLSADRRDQKQASLHLFGKITSAAQQRDLAGT